MELNSDEEIFILLSGPEYNRDTMVVKDRML
jgi:hypothetical protein